MADLHDLLLVEIGGRIEADRREVAHAGQAVKLRAQLRAIGPCVARGEVLDENALTRMLAAGEVIERAAQFSALDHLLRQS